MALMTWLPNVVVLVLRGVALVGTGDACFWCIPVSSVTVRLAGPRVTRRHTDEVIARCDALP